MMAESNKELSKTLETIDEAIKTGNWSDEALDKLNNLVIDIENEEKSYNRFLLRNQQYGFRRGGRIYETASLILGRNEETSRKKSPNKGGKREETILKKANRRENEGREQERLIESWAKAQDLWLNDYEDPNGNRANSLEDLMASQWDYYDRGSESIVYIYDQNTVIKTINLSHYDNSLFRTLDKIALHNTLSPSTALEVVGFGRDSLGHFQIVALQPFIQGEELTETEFEEFKEKLNTEEEGWYYVDNYKITDIAPYNILKYYNQQTGKNEYFIVDADFWIDAEDYEIDNSIKDNNISKENNEKLNDELPFYKTQTPHGEVEIYGFIDPKTREMYLDDAIIRPEHPIHEYTHLWDRAVAERNPELWSCK